MSFFDVVKNQIGSFSDDELYTFKRLIEDDLSRRSRERQNSFNTNAMKRFLSVWPNLTTQR